MLYLIKIDTSHLRHGKLAVPSHLNLKLLITIAEELGLTELAMLMKEKDVPRLGDWIKLNVGGTVFETSRQTLTQVPDSLLGRMFDPDSSLPPARLQDGAFLIDSSPSSFPVILHWLRHREVALGEVTVETALSTANYFGLQGLVEALDEIVKKKEEEPEGESDWIKLSADGTIFETSRRALIKAGHIRMSGSKWTRQDYSLLAQMFDPSRRDYSPPSRDANGVYLIDCNPRIFSVVLDMVRNRRLNRCSGITKENYSDVDLACRRYIGLPLDCSNFFDFDIDVNGKKKWW